MSSLRNWGRCGVVVTTCMIFRAEISIGSLPYCALCSCTLINALAFVSVYVRTLSQLLGRHKFILVRHVRRFVRACTALAVRAQCSCRSVCVRLCTCCVCTCTLACATVERQQLCVRLYAHWLALASCVCTGRPQFVCG